MSHNYTTKDIARFNKKINKDAPNGCWEWQASCNNYGYGQIKINGNVIKTHRVSYEINVGKIPDGMLVCHKCDNPKCVNPDHLFLGTNADNMRDKNEKGRTVGYKNGGLNTNSKLTEQDVIHIREMYSGKFKQRVIAEKYGVSQPTISSIIRRQGWSHVP